MPRLYRGYLLAVSVLNGLAGLVCGVLFVAEPGGGLMGAQALLPIIGKLPLASVFFRDFLWIGIAMLLVLGIPNTVAAVQLIRRTAEQYVWTLVAGVLLVLWTGFELVFMYNVLAVVYFVVGVLSIAASLLQTRSGGVRSA